MTFQTVLTKADKPTKADLAAVIADTAAKLAKQPAAFPGIIVTSAETGDGLPALRSSIWEMAAGA